MITPQLNIAEAPYLPIGIGVRTPQTATPDFAALFALVAVAPQAEATVPTVPMQLVTREPMVLSLPAEPAEIQSARLAALPVLAQFCVLPAIGAALGKQTSAAVTPIVGEDYSPTSVEPTSADAEPAAAETSGSVAVPLMLVSASATISVHGPPMPQAEPQRIVESKARQPDAALVTIAASVVVGPAKRATGAIVEPAALSLAPLSEMRATALVGIVDKLFVPTPDRVVMLAPAFADGMRDVVAIAHDKDVRFNVRPESLGSVAVTIERTEAGPTLRLGVETLAAVQAVRQAEPMMNDARGSIPFVHVTVDMNAPDSRGRSPRTMTPQRVAQDQVSEQTQRQLPVSTGRFA